MIVFCIDSVERFDFFYRMYEALRANYGIKLVTTEPLVWLKAKYNGLSVTLITSSELKIDDLKRYVESSIEVLNNQYTERQAEKYFSSIVKALMDEDLKSKFVVWNGQHVFGRALEYIADKEGVYVRFLEISNLPSLIFSDPMGVNANSSIAKEPELLDLYPPVDNEHHQLWIKSYLKEKEKPLPQARKGVGKKLQSFLNTLFKRMYPAVNVNSFSVMYSKSKPPKLIASGAWKEVRGYVFLPLQVSTDTQIKLHSEINNIAAIKVASDIAMNLGAPFICKIHPAETSVDEVRNIEEAVARLGGVISVENTTKLIEGSAAVVTINSTVGLEALILDKKVIVLGSALYKNFNQDRLKKYIHHYLIPGIDYFGYEKISVESAERVIGL